jgi:ElaB/YqjD/DUF883 family membrane-anchored ribosome-binding protein
MEVDVDAEIRELKHAVQELAFGLDEALAADAAGDKGDFDSYRALNERARQRVKKLQIRMGQSATGIPHILAG